MLERILIVAGDVNLLQAMRPRLVETCDIEES